MEARRYSRECWGSIAEQSERLIKKASVSKFPVGMILMKRLQTKAYDVFRVDTNSRMEQGPGVVIVSEIFNN